MYDIKNIWSLVTKIIDIFIRPEKESKENTTQIGTGNISAKGNNIIIKSGDISISQVEKIANIVSKLNRPELEKIAIETYDKRVYELNKSIILALKCNQKYIHIFSEPYMQISLSDAQKAFAKDGDDNLKIMLVNFITNLVKADPKSLTKIIFEESINIAPKLIVQQYDILSLVFLLLYAPNYKLSNWEDFENLLNVYIFPFIESLTENATCYRHIEYTGCAFIKTGYYLIEDLLAFYYPGFFCNGFTKERFEKDVDINISKYMDDGILIKCFHNDHLYQINAIYKNDIKGKCQEKHYDDSLIFKINKIQREHLMNNAMIKNTIIETNKNKDFLKLFSIWDNSFIKHLELTSIGIAIAISNIKRKVGESLDYSIWLNEKSDFNLFESQLKKIPKIFDGGYF